MNHEAYMRLALIEARLAYGHGDVPVGAVVVSADGTVIGRGRNRREVGHDATAHAEVEAIREACAAVGSWRLHGASLYVTLEPCPMCAGAIINARVSRVVFGAFDPKAGCFGSLADFAVTGFNHRPELSAGVRADECAALLKDFFAELRK